MKRIIAAALGAVMMIASLAPVSFALDANFVKTADFYINDGAEGDIRTSFKPTASNADNQTNVFDETIVKEEGTKSIKFAFENALDGKEANINHRNGIDVSSVKASGYLCFDMYIDTEITNTLLPNIKLIDKDGGESSVVALSGLSYKEWNEVSVKLTDFGNGVNLEKFRCVSVSLPQTVSEEYTVYIQSIAVYDAPFLEITSSSWKDGKVELSWDYSSTASKYEVYLNGESVGETTGNTFTYDYDGTEAMITLQVKALDENNAVVAESEEATCAFSDIYSKKILSYYENTSTSTARDTWTVEKDATAPLGGYKLVTDNVKGIIDGPGTKDISDYVEDGYLGFYLKSETDEPWQIELSNGDSLGWKRSRYTVKSSDITDGKWQFVKINLSDFVPEAGFDYSDVELIVFLQDNTCKKEIQGLAVYKTIAKPEATVTESGINENGKAYVKLSFTDEMAEDAFVKANFAISGMNCIGAELMPNGKNAELTFDTVFEFPKTYELIVSESVLNKDGLPLLENKVRFTTADAHNCVKASVSEPQITGTTLKYSAAVKSIYSPDGGEQDITMLVVVYSGQKIINVGYDSKTNVAVNSSSTFSYTAYLGAETDMTNIRTEVYFVNDLTEGRPLCESKSF